MRTAEETLWKLENTMGFLEEKDLSRIPQTRRDAMRELHGDASACAGLLLFLPAKTQIEGKLDALKNCHSLG
ncbi:hypothetical protein V6N11_031529 [Hibiscus sabdariffa]|uniref:Uncharacterized protein n=1 Tax=Hibiscus sabdariffa TaxID=183260 RepID=A0ABR2SYH1_9ROSI